MNPFIAAVIVVFMAVNSMASDSILSLCSEVALKAAGEEFAKAMEIHTSAINDLARVYEPFYDEADPESMLTVEMSTLNPDVWDGFATYKVIVEKSELTCEFKQVILNHSEGF